MRLTRQAKLRSRERGCQLLSVTLIKRFGQSQRAPGGARVWMANRRERGRIREALKAVLRDFEKPDPPYFQVSLKAAPAASEPMGAA